MQFCLAKEVKSPENVQLLEVILSTVGILFSIIIYYVLLLTSSLSLCIHFLYTLMIPDDRIHSTFTSRGKFIIIIDIEIIYNILKLTTIVVYK